MTNLNHHKTSLKIPKRPDYKTYTRSTNNANPINWCKPISFLWLSQAMTWMSNVIFVVLFAVQ